MKVYVLTVTEVKTFDSYTAAVFDKPKTARQFILNKWDIDTRKKWKRHDNGVRMYVSDDEIYSLEEFKVVKDKVT